MLKEALCKDPALMILDICNGAGLIDMGVNASSVGWWLSYSWKTKIRTTTYITLNVDFGNKATKWSDVGKCEHHNHMNAAKLFCSNIYGVIFLVETDANTLVH